MTAPTRSERMDASRNPASDLIAVSMRRQAETAYPEERDAIARDWWPFLKVALPGVLPVLLPNDAEYALATCRLPRLIGLLLTGGNDVGACPERDRAEEIAFHGVRARGLPVLGICRGLQFLVHLHGGALAAGDPEIHRAKRHRVEIFEPWERSSRVVNSYHAIEARLPPRGDLVATATAPDGTLEAFQHRTEPIAGIHWHPEREDRPDPGDIDLFRRLFRTGVDATRGTIEPSGMG